MEEKIKSDNLIIAEFMEVDFSMPYCYGPGRYTDMLEEYLDYDTNWGWLMPVIDKINCMPNYSAVILHNQCYITNGNGYGNNMVSDSTLLAVYFGVIEFIKWYNEK